MRPRVDQGLSKGKFLTRVPPCGTGAGGTGTGTGQNRHHWPNTATEFIIPVISLLLFLVNTDCLSTRVLFSFLILSLSHRQGAATRSFLVLSCH